MIFCLVCCYGITKGEKMLEYLRNAADKPLAKVLMFVLIFSFVGWGAAEWIFGGVSRDTTLIHVGDAEISLQQFNEERSNQLATMTKDEQRAAYTDPAKSAELTQNVMSKLTMNQLMANRAYDLGFIVSDKRIVDEIRATEQFQSNGEFMPWMFDSALRNAGLTEQDYINALRSGMLRQMTVGATNVPVAVPEFAVDVMYNARYSTRDIKYIGVKFADFKIPEPNEEQLQSFYVQNPKVIPETRSVSYVFVAADNNKPDEYDEGFKKAQTIEDMIISGESMKDSAEKYKAKFVKIDNVKRGDKLSDKILTDDLVAKLFSMEAGVESELLELKEGFAILRVDTIVPEHNADFKDAKKEIIGKWKKAEQRKNAYIAANDMLINLNKNGSLKNTKSASVTRTEGAPLSVLSATFAGQEGNNLIVEDNDAFYVLHIGKNVMPKPDSKKKESIRKELEQMSSKYVMDDYSQFLKRHYPVEVNEKVYRRFITK